MMHQCLAAEACEGNFDALKMLLGEENRQGSTAGEASAAQQLMVHYWRLPLCRGPEALGKGPLTLGKGCTEGGFRQRALGEF